MSNNGDNVTLRNNTTWNNKSYGYSVNSDTIVSNNIASESLKRYGKGIESDNSWQRSGNVSFVSTDSKSSYFLVPTTNGGFEDIGAYSDMDFGVSYSPDLVVTQVSYANGIFTSTVKNQGAAATPPGVAIELRILLMVFTELGENTRNLYRQEHQSISVRKESHISFLLVLTSLMLT